MDMQSACAEVLAEVDGALGCVVIDMQTGLTVAGEYRQGSVMNPATVNLVSVLSANMFQGKLIRQFEGALARRPESQGFVREVQMTTEHTNQFMAAVPGWNQTLLVLVTDKTVSVGLGWMAVHRLIGRFGDAAPQAAMAPAAHPPATAHPAARGAVPNEPFPDANRYAPPPTTQPVAAGPPPATARQAPTRRYRGAPVAQEPAQPEPPPEPEKKPRVVMGPRVSMFRRK